MRASVYESVHDVLELFGAHLPVCGLYENFRHKPRNKKLHIIEALDPIMKIVHLPSPPYFSTDRFCYDLFIVFLDRSLYRQPVVWSRLQHRHIPYFEQGHMQRPRYGGCRQGKAVDGCFHFFEPFLVLHAEALLLVYDKQPQILEPYVVLQNSVRTYDEINLSVFEFFHHQFLFFRRDETGKHSNPNRIGCKPFRKIFEVLLCKDSSGCEQSDLLPAHDRLERSAHCDFGLSESDIAADEPVHRGRILHIAFHVLYAGELILGLFERKGGFEFELPFRIFGKRIARSRFPFRIQLYEPLCDIFYGFPNLILSVFPGSPPDFIETRSSAFVCYVTLNEIHLFDRDINHFLIRVFQVYVIALVPCCDKTLNAVESSYAVIHMHDIIPRIEFHEGIYGLALHLLKR